MCVFLCISLFVCAAMRHARQQTKFHNFSTVAAAVMLLSVWIFSLCSFSVALKRQSMLGLKIDSLSNVNDDDISRIVFAKLYARQGGVEFLIKNCLCPQPA